MMPPIATTSFLMSSAMPPLQYLIFYMVMPPLQPKQYLPATSPSAILSCNVSPCNFAILQHNISSLIITILYQIVPPAISPLAMSLFYGRKYPIAMLPCYDAPFLQHLQFSPCHLLPPSHLQPYPKQCNWNCSCRINT